MLTRTQNFIALPRARKRLLLEAAVALVRAWWMVRLCRFHSYAPTLGRLHRGEFIDKTNQNIPSAPLRQVRWALNKFNRLIGGRFTCLMLAIAGKRLLNRRGLANSLVLGVNPHNADGSSTIGAHAWLRSGRYVVIGLEERAGHIPVASYHSGGENPPLSRRIS